MSSLERHPDWQSVIIRTPPISSSNMSKPGKNLKIRYISIITQKSDIYKSQKLILIWLGVFRSVRHLEVHIYMRSSDATCCGGMAVNLCFFSALATTWKIWPPGAPKLGAELIFMSPLGHPPDWHTIIIHTPPFSTSNMSKTGKIQKIR